MTKVRLLAALGASGVLAAIGFAPSVQAHTTCMYHNNDYACVHGEEHGVITACDKEIDGNRVRAQFYVILDPNRRYGNWDTAGDGCARNTPGISITSYRVCEEDRGCSDWRRP